MKAKVNAYESVTFHGIRHHQGDEFEFNSLREIADISKQVSVIDQETEKVEDTHNDEEA